jgi:VIT1/CCC1 family predicted Fe2+/Mn2+ transporter
MKSAGSDPGPFAWFRDELRDRESLQRLIVDANDGVIATAGIVEGFSSAGAGEGTLLIAALTATIAGAIGLAGAQYTEAAGERDMELALLDDERRRLALGPEEEQAELAALYEDKGISPGLAREVAADLSARDALRAHAEAEYGISSADQKTRPVLTATASGLMFALGSSLPLATILLGSAGTRVEITFLAVVAALTLTSVVGARLGGASVMRTVTRTVAIGSLTMLLTILLAGLVGI